MASSLSVLAIAIDSLEETLFRRLLDEGALPNAASLLRGGSITSLGTPSIYSSGSVWPTFMTGSPPEKHGVYSEWLWQPQTMTIESYVPSNLVPFWVDLVHRGISVGVVDIPWAPRIGIEDGFEVSEWGAHDVYFGDTFASPASIRDVIGANEPHPYGNSPPRCAGLADTEGLKRVAESSILGAQRRGRLAEALIEKSAPDIAIVAFTEFHHTGHNLWHTVDPNHPDHRPSSAASPLRDLVISIDEQIGKLSRYVKDGGSLLVFSAHGMKPQRGFPQYHRPLLQERGLASPLSWRTSSWPERRAELAAALKRAAPSPLKNLYHRRASRSLQRRMAPSSVFERYDWRTTRAFGLPTDQHGWVRVNLNSREALGIVPLSDYEDVRSELEDLVRAERTVSGAPLVDRIVRPSTDGGPQALALPDLVVHWSPETVTEATRLDEGGNAHSDRTGQHSTNSFCLWAGEALELAAGDVALSDLARLLSQLCSTRK